ncbi:MAG: hypothetical protein L3J86_06310, partial [Thermoplasmata archaeon]|nr:hypothetical protein [Thermoplasmata archaeon]
LIGVSGPRRNVRVAGVVTDPLWVARGSSVILNGHHRYAALQALGATHAPAWVVDYDDPLIELSRWYDGPALSKEEVISRARARKPFPPKTTKHLVRLALPAHPTTLEELGVPTPSELDRGPGR